MVDYNLPEALGKTSYWQTEDASFPSVPAKELVLVFNPNYSGDRDQEDRGSNPAWANSSQDPISKKPFTKNCW
jgi:hypothetical protein